MNKILAKTINLLLNIGPIILIIMFLEGQWIFFGLLGYLFVYAIIIFIRIYKSGVLMNGIRAVETAVWKKPLDKDMWDKGELKNTKVKIVWRKKHEKEKTDV